MTVGELITRLQQCDPNLPVCLADWNEEWSRPSEEAAEVVSECECYYYSKEQKALIQGKCVVLG